MSESIESQENEILNNQEEEKSNLSVIDKNKHKNNLWELRKRPSDISFYWLNDITRQFLNRGYLVDGMCAEDRLWQIALEAEQNLGISGFADKFYTYMSKGYYSLSTPIWANYGLSRGLPISCFSVDIGDSMSEILYAHGEVGMMSKYGGGTGGFFGHLRGRGTEISQNGVSSGAVHAIRLFETLINVVSQGSTRRGSFAAYLPIEHPDIEEFLEIGTEGNEIQIMTTAVTVTDAFMNDMIAGDKDKRAIWAKVLQRRGEMGYPYIMFVDTANRDTVDVYKDKELKIRHSNLCFVGSDRVVSDRGYLTAKELYEQGGELTLFNGKEAVKSSEMKLRESNVDVYKVTLANGMEHTVTDYHGMAKYDKDGKITRTPLKDLKIGDRIALQVNKGLFGSKSMVDEAFLLGMYQSDGTQHKDIKASDLWKKSNALKKSLNFEKGYVPSWIWESDEETQWSYVRGLLYADGSTHLSNSDGNSIQVAYVDINVDFLKELQILFTNLGLSSNIYTQTGYRLVVSNKQDVLVIENKSSEIVSIELVGKEDVYCPTVYNDEHLFVCNGMLTFNCAEIMLPTNDEWSFVCDLSSMNVLHYDEWKDTDAVEVMVYFLDAVMNDFIQKLKKVKNGTEKKHKDAFYLMERAYNFAVAHRALGLGAFGWHSYLQSKNLSFESLDAKKLNVEIFERINVQAHAASKKLADIFGEPSLLKGYGRRNTTLTAIAPTTSSAFIIGQTSQGIEPVWSNYYVKDTAKAKVSIKNPFLVKLLDEKGRNNREVWESIRNHDGSVQHLEFLSDHEKEVFKTFCEIDQNVIIEQAGTRQAFVDQGQSLNVMVNPKVPAKDINKLMILAWKLGVKSLYYQHSTSAAQDFNRSKMCEGACEA